MLVGINKDLLNGFATVQVWLDFEPSKLHIFTSHLDVGISDSFVTDCKIISCLSRLDT